MEVTICSRASAERMLAECFPANTLVISFYDPPSRRGRDTPPVDYRGKADEIIYVPIHDIDLGVLPEFGLDYESYFPEASKVARAVMEAYESGKDIICQCEYGQSRSAACAAAIREFLFRDGIWVFADYRYYPNQLVFHKVYDALMRYKNIKET